MDLIQGGGIDHHGARGGWHGAATIGMAATARDQGIAKPRRGRYGIGQSINGDGPDNGGGDGLPAGDVMGMVRPQLGVGYQLVLGQAIP